MLLPQDRVVLATNTLTQRNNTIEKIPLEGLQFLRGLLELPSTLQSPPSPQAVGQSGPFRLPSVPLSSNKQVQPGRYPPQRVILSTNCQKACHREGLQTSMSGLLELPSTLQSRQSPRATELRGLRLVLPSVQLLTLQSQQSPRATEPSGLRLVLPSVLLLTLQSQQSPRATEPSGLRLVLPSVQLSHHKISMGSQPVVEVSTAFN